jgi:hypothetical protein
MLTYPNKSHRQIFITPEFSENLAEFCGIMLGDGGISKYQAKVTLNSGEESEYGAFIVNLIEDIFQIQSGLTRRTDSNAFDIVISRIGIVEFLTDVCGLKLGNKIIQKADIPQWIKENTLYATACMRGLFDTDGSIFTHKYISKGKEYSYKKLGFTSVSEPLLYSAHTILNDAGLNARFGSRFDVRVDSKADVQRYFEIFGSHNTKHLNRYAS